MDKPAAAARELERALGDLKLIGIQLFSNALGKPLDLPEFRPIFEIM
jgi:aminocarboxymuconate-semialdehyde decarboxylase